MLRLLFIAEATFIQSTECVYSVHNTAVGFRLHFREKGVSSGFLNTVYKGLSKCFYRLMLFLMLRILRIWFLKNLFYFSKHSFYRGTLERKE